MIPALGTILLLGAICSPGHVHAGDGSAIVTAARSQIGIPYVFGGGGKNGASKNRTSTVAGFDCSGLAQYAVYQGTGRGTFLDRPANSQYNNAACSNVSSAAATRKPGDLIFWGTSRRVRHVGIVSGTGKVIHAPGDGQNVKEGNIWNAELRPVARRCWVE